MLVNGNEDTSLEVIFTLTDDRDGSTKLDSCQTLLHSRWPSLLIKCCTPSPQKLVVTMTVTPAATANWMAKMFTPAVPWVRTQSLCFIGNRSESAFRAVQAVSGNVAASSKDRLSCIIGTRPVFSKMP